MRKRGRLDLAALAVLDLIAKPRLHIDARFRPILLPGISRCTSQVGIALIVDHPWSITAPVVFLESRSASLQTKETALDDAVMFDPVSIFYGHLWFINKLYAL